MSFLVMQGSGLADRRPLPAGALPGILAALLAAVALAALLVSAGGLGVRYVAKALLGVTLGVSILVASVRAGHPHERFGAANHVTLARAVIVALCAALIGEREASHLAWLLVAAASLAAALDGVDGALARRTGLQSPFGQRFDMEVDALLILVLAALAWQLGKAGPWILLAGTMRYAFIAAGWGLAWMRGPLPPSRRRKTIAVVQTIALIVAVAPFVPPALSAPVAALALAALCASFARDVLVLVRAARLTPSTASVALFTLVILALAGAASPLRAEPARYEIDPEHVSLGFLVEHIGFAKVLGTFREVAGSYVFDEATGSLSELRVVVRTESVSSGHERRDRHLRGADFLDVERHPEMIFTANAAQRTGERSFRIEGMLELRGQRRPLTLEAHWNRSATYPIGGPGGVKPYVMGVSARGLLRRSDFGIRYALDNGWVGDEVELIVELEARRK